MVSVQEQALSLAALLDQWDGAYSRMEVNRQREEAARLLRALATPQPDQSQVSRGAVDPEFVRRMEVELHENVHKGDWRSFVSEDDADATVVRREIEHHWEKLRLALLSGRWHRAQEYAADLGNCAMFAHAYAYAQAEAGAP